MSVVLARQNAWGKITRGDLAPRKMLLQSSVGFVENIHKLKNSDRTVFYTPLEPEAMPAPTSTRAEKREFVVDSGASMHMMSRKRTRLRRDEHSK